jgi:metal-responsive CopG/Arc/MetJ family transcriptional regulator
MSAVKISVSIPDKLLKQMEDRQQELGYPNFSHYVQAIAYLDVQERPSHIRGSPGSRSYAFNEDPPKPKKGRSLRPKQ